MIATFILILPDFLLMVLGYVLLRRQFLPPAFFTAAEKLVYYVMFPALLFTSMANNELSLQQISTLGLSAALIVLTGTLLAFLAIPILKPDTMRHASVAQCAYRFNSYLAFSIAYALGGETALGAMAVITVVAIPLANIAAVSTLAQQNKNNLLGPILKNPLIISTLAGLVWNITGLGLPAVVDGTLSKLGSSALALALICVGASFTLQALQGAHRLVSWMLVIKLLLLPLVALLINSLMPLTPLEQQMLLLFATLPTASTTYVLAMRMGGDGKLVAFTVSVSTFLSVFTIPLWLMISY